MTRPSSRWATAQAIVTAGVIGVLLLAGCGTPSGGPSGSEVRDEGVGSGGSSGSTSPSASHDPSRLVGVWTISGTGTPDDGAVAYLTPSATIYRACGALDALVTAAPTGEFRARAESTTGNCPDYASVLEDAGHWLLRTTAFSVRSDGVELTDAAGKRLAHLTAGGTPSISPDIWAESVVPPSLDSATSARLAPRRPAVPGGLAAPNREQLTRRWLPTDAHGMSAPEAHVAFEADGTWRGSDGCNGLSGTWALADGGWWAATSGGQTAIGCDNSEVSSWLVGAWQVGLTANGARLVLFAPDGSELGRLTAA